MTPRWLPFDVRFESYVERADGCWLWRGPRMGNGYGEINRGRKVLLAHRVSYSKHVGPIPEGMKVCHRCDTPACVRPDHLFLGSQADNLADMMAKGRHRPAGAAGSKNKSAKLNESAVRAMRVEPRLPGERATAFYRRVGAKYGVGRAGAHYVLAGGGWRHVR